MAAITAGAHHTCALGEDGAASCWGLGTEGQLGADDRESSSFPVDVAGSMRFSELSAGRAHTCAVTLADRVACWGTDESGQLGDGREEEAGSPRPVLVRELDHVLSVSAGSEHTCVRRENDEVFCWGANDYGQLGDGTFLAARHPVPGPASAVEIAAGAEHTCVMHYWGMVTCWGGNDHGQLGDGRIGWRARPAAALRVRGAIGLTAGGNHTCAIRETGAVCWGSNLDGELGEVSAQASSTPVAAIVAQQPDELSLALGRDLRPGALRRRALRG